MNVNKRLLLLFLLCFSLFFVFAQEKTVYFYGATTNSLDTTTLKLTEDLFFTQFSTLNTYKVQDNRSSAWKQEFIDLHGEPSSVIFYVSIEVDGAKWNCTLTLIDSATKALFTKKDTYEGYYKILMDAKNSLNILLSEYDFSKLVVESAAESKSETTKAITKLTLDSIAGTWVSNENLTKIVILRSGRGFVIFKNGASMNISVSLTGTEVVAKQTSNANASFFPDLPREVALVVAQSADPIEWKLSTKDGKTLLGTKTTLLPTASKSASKGSVDVVWTKSE